MRTHPTAYRPLHSSAPDAIEPRHSIAALLAIVLAHATVFTLFLATPRHAPKEISPEPLMVDLIPLAAHAPRPARLTPPAEAVRPPTPRTPRSPPAHKKPPPAVASPQLAVAATEALPGESAAAPQAPASSLPAGSPTTDNAGPLTEPRYDADYLRNPPPAYPMISRRFREEGRVVLRVFVNAEGQATQVDIKSSSSFQRLDQAARQAVSQWRFVPARRSNTPVGAWVLVPIVFNLNA